MEIITLQAIPNQKFSIRLDNDFYDITIKETNGVMCSSISRNGTVLQQGARIATGTLMLPYLYQENTAGNFFIATEDGDLPEYTKFGITQFLCYLSAAELAELRQ